MSNKKKEDPTSVDFLQFKKVFLLNIDVFQYGGREAIRQFADKSSQDKHLVIIPLQTIKEIQRLSMSERETAESMSAKNVMEYITPKTVGGSGSKPIYLENNLWVSIPQAKIIHKDSRTTFTESAKHLHSQGEGKLRVITNHDDLLIELRLQNITCEESSFDKIDPNLVYSGMVEVEADELLGRLINTEGHSLPVSELEEAIEHELFRATDIPLREKGKKYLYLNQFVVFNSDGKKSYGIIRGKPIRSRDERRMIDQENVMIKLISEQELHRVRELNILGIKPKNIEQALAMNYLLMDSNIETAFIIGSQGTGKTQIIYPCAISQILVGPGAKSDSGPRYKLVRLVKPDTPVGGEDRLGFLPGSYIEKIMPYIKSFVDAHENTQLKCSFERMLEHPDRKEIGKYLELRPKNVDLGVSGYHLPSNNVAIEFEHLQYLRGRSYANSFVFADELQNAWLDEAKFLSGRPAVGSKMVIGGDVEQIDNPKCSLRKNGLLALLNHFLGRPYVGVIYLTENFRTSMSSDSSTMQSF